MRTYSRLVMAFAAVATIAAVAPVRAQEMHLIARRAHQVTIPEVGTIALDAGESIRTELSYKYDRAILEDMLCASGLLMERWMPGEDGSFALALARAES